MPTLRIAIGGESREIRLDDNEARLDGRAVTFRAVRRNGELAAVETAGEVFPVRIARQGDRAFVWCAGEVFEARREAARPPTAAGAPRRPSAEAHGGLIAPMPGRVRTTLVRKGEEVSKGQIVLVLEAMKMEHAIRAPRAGVVTRIEHAEGDLVDAGTVLAEISEASEPEHGT